MSKMIYSAISSLDGFVADEDGNFDWAEPDEEVHSFINELTRPIGTYLYGRRLYEVMIAWDTLTLDDQLPHLKEFAEIWQAADKVVFSKSLGKVATAKTRIERDFDPEAIEQLKASAERDLTVGGPDLAAHAFRAGLIDECHLFVAPMLVGGGKQSLPNNLRLELELLEEHGFGNGMVYLRYRTGIEE